ncbi:MAG: hypothetical protein JXJ20_00645 [Anaerolineae bacterium]|jgi:hypothetical protein|nr:hypothetical protein [Anaerolineae bacterium]
MKRLLPLLLAVVLALFLTACSSNPVKDAYTAAGDGTRPDDLNKTTAFVPDDDLNVVVTLNAHDRTLPIMAVFVGPDESTYSTDPLDADETVGVVLLGLDWEALGSREWSVGNWRVDIYVEGHKEHTLKFSITQPESAG